MEKTKPEHLGKTYNFLFDLKKGSIDAKTKNQVLFVLRKMLDIEFGFDYIFNLEYDNFRKSIDNLVIIGVLINIRSLQDFFKMNKKSYKMRLYREFANMEAHRFFDNDYLWWGGMNKKLTHFELLNYGEFMKNYKKGFYKGKGRFPKKIYEIANEYVENYKKAKNIYRYSDYYDEARMLRLEEEIGRNFFMITYGDFIDIDNEFYECAKNFFKK